MNARAALALLSLAPMATGCVAAAAIPLAAGVAVVRSHAGPDPKGVRAAVPVPRPQPGMASDASDYRVVLTELTALPPPDAAVSGATREAAALQAYVAGQLAAVPSGGKPRLGALLSRPGELSAQRRECRATANGVFIDLDPGRGSFDPLAPGRAETGLVRALAALRSQGVAVVWFSRLGENFADAVRAALTASGLDPEGHDRIVLMRDIGERKQTRRAAIADTLCPVALVGDERADFDELFLYLRSPDAAAPLDALIGRGWFLLSPFAPPPPTTEVSPP